MKATTITSITISSALLLSLLPYYVQAAPEQCLNIRSQNADGRCASLIRKNQNGFGCQCYNFCNGNLVNCALNIPNCGGELVTGCTIDDLNNGAFSVDTFTGAGTGGGNVDITPPTTGTTTEDEDEPELYIGVDEPETDIDEPETDVDEPETDVDEPKDEVGTPTEEVADTMPIIDAPDTPEMTVEDTTEGGDDGADVNVVVTTPTTGGTTTGGSSGNVVFTVISNPPPKGRTPEQIPEETPEQIPDDTTEQIPVDTPEQIPVDTPEDTPEQMPEETPEQMPEETPEQMPEETPEQLPENTPEQMPEYTPEQMPVDTPDMTPEDGSTNDAPTGDGANTDIEDGSNPDDGNEFTGDTVDDGNVLNTDVGEPVPEEAPPTDKGTIEEDPADENEPDDGDERPANIPSNPAFGNGWSATVKINGSNPSTTTVVNETGGSDTSSSTEETPSSGGGSSTKYYNGGDWSVTISSKNWDGSITETSSSTTTTENNDGGTFTESGSSAILGKVDVPQANTPTDNTGDISSSRSGKGKNNLKGTKSQQDAVVPSEVQEEESAALRSVSFLLCIATTLFVTAFTGL